MLINDKMPNNHVYKVETICTIRGVMATTANAKDKNDIYKILGCKLLTGKVELNTRYQSMKEISY